jgi:hypothetical protein
LFSGEMVRAILEDRKTQTRRIVNLDTLRVHLPRRVTSDLSELFKDELVEAHVGVHGAQLHEQGAVSVAAGDGWLGVKPGEFHFVCPYAEGDTHLGDHGGDRKMWTIKPRPSRLWVKETFQIESNRGIDDNTSYPPRFNDGRPIRWHEENDWGKWWQQPHYRATESEHDLADYEEQDENGDDKPLGWKPSIFMPRWASRIDLEVTGVRVERLQEITEDDARAEGVSLFDRKYMHIGPDQRLTTGEIWRDAPYRASFAVLWDEINGDRALWESNPWVWVVSFKRVRP